MRMRVAIAFLVNDVICNRMAHVTMRCRNYGFGLRVLRLPAHVSLKQPFVVNEFARFESYFDELATRIEPQRLRFDGYRYWGTPEQGVVAAHVAATPRLRELHANLNRELQEQFGNTSADHDGDDYEFHLTVAIGSCNAAALPQLESDMMGWEVDEYADASRLAMFIYEESPQADPLFGIREYGTYRVVPLKSIRR